MLKSLVKLARNRGYAFRELVDRLKDLKPLSHHMDLDDDDAGSLDEIVRQMKRMPELSELMNGRNSLVEAGHVPLPEAGHTLKIPLADDRSTDTEFLCVTRLAEEKWTFYRDRLPK